MRLIGKKAWLLWVQPGKGEPKLLAAFRTGAITGCRFTPESKDVVFVYTTPSRGVVLFSGLQ